MAQLKSTTISGSLIVTTDTLYMNNYGFVFPTKTGTVALLDDITWNNLRGKPLPTFPNKSGTVALLDDIPDLSNTHFTDIYCDGTLFVERIVSSKIKNDGFIRFLDNNGSTTLAVSVSASGSTQSYRSISAPSFYANSDIRLKKNILQLTDFDWYDLLKKINIYKFDWKNEANNIENTHCLGTIAQEMQNIMPKEFKKYFVNDDNSKDHILSINDSKLVYLTIGALQQQIEINKKLEEKIDLLEKQINQLWRK